MLATLSPAKSGSFARACLFVDALVMVGCVVVGARSGEYAYLIAAFGLAILAPLWFRHPVSLAMPIRDLLRGRA